MRKVLFICLAAACLLALTACADDGKITLATPSPSASAPANTPAQASADEVASVSSVPPAATVSPQTAQSPKAQQSQGPIIAESSNTVSDKEKEAILDELAAELDSAFGGVDSLEELSDSDLDVSGIN